MKVLKVNELVKGCLYIKVSPTSFGSLLQGRIFLVYNILPTNIRIFKLCPIKGYENRLLRGSISIYSQELFIKLGDAV
jgi:hypothetical protein